MLPVMVIMKSMTTAVVMNVIMNFVVNVNALIFISIMHTLMTGSVLGMLAVVKALSRLEFRMVI